MERSTRLRLVGGETPHHGGHCQRRLSRLAPAVVIRVQATDLRLLFVFQQQNFVNDRHAMRNLDVHQRPAHRFADVGGMRGLATQDDPEAEDGGEACCVLRVA